MGGEVAVVAGGVGQAAMVVMMRVAALYSRAAVAPNSRRPSEVGCCIVRFCCLTLRRSIRRRCPQIHTVPSVHAEVHCACTAGRNSRSNHTTH